MSRHGDVLVAAQAADERSITHALKQLDDRLILAVNPDEETGRHVWQVLCRVASDRPAETVLSWRDEHLRPLPLSHMLVEEVKRLRQVDTYADVLASNRRLRERADQDDIAEATAIAADMLPRIKGRKSSPLHRSVGLRQARSRTGRGR